MKSTSTAYLLWFFLGVLGVHKFYLDKTGMGILYLFTFGIFGIGWFIDLFTLGDQVNTYNSFHNRQFGKSIPNSSTNNVIINTQDKNRDNSESITDRLHKLHDLKEKGILSEEEFNIQKARVLA